MPNGPVWNEALLKADGVFPTVLAIGDSWFWYPKNNLAIPLHKILNREKAHVILVRGHNGAEAIEYQSGPLRNQIEQDLDVARGYGRTLKAVFISGGGNDFAGRDDLPTVLLPDCTGKTSAEQCLRPGQPESLFGTVFDALVGVYDLVQEKIPSTPVFVHGYDYACPNGKGFFGLGQWLQYPMDQCRVSRNLQQEVVNTLIDRFAVMLQEAQRRSPHLHVVNEVGTLTTGDWANELHPTPAGFNRLAKCWRPLLKSTGVA